MSNTTGTGVFILLLINLIVFVLDHSFHLPQIRTLYLDHIGPKWWQFITSSFCHASWQHLSSNTFLLYVFGKIVEEEEGIWGVWLTYLITAVGAYSILAYTSHEVLMTMFLVSYTQHVCKCSNTSDGMLYSRTFCVCLILRCPAKRTEAACVMQQVQA